MNNLFFTFVLYILFHRIANPNKRGTLPQQQEVRGWRLEVSKKILNSENKRDIRCLHRVSQDCVPDSSLNNDSSPENDIAKGNKFKDSEENSP